MTRRKRRRLPKRQPMTTTETVHYNLYIYIVFNFYSVFQETKTKIRQQEIKEEMKEKKRQLTLCL